MEPKYIALGIHVLSCYLIAAFARKYRKLGFAEAFLLSFMFPAVGLLVVYFSAHKNAVEKMPPKPVLKPELTDDEQKDFSVLLKKYHQKKITKEEFETRVATFK